MTPVQVPGSHSVQPPAHPVPALREHFWPQANADTLALLQDPTLSLSFNARGALWEIGCELMAEPSTRTEVLLPAFHCPSGVTPLLEAGLTPVYYRIRPDLSIDTEDLLAKVSSKTRAVLAIHFFGFEADLAPLQALRATGIALIEDWSHGFLQYAPLALPRAQGDYQVFSFWKLVACDVGGGLRRLGPTPPRRWQRDAAPRRDTLRRLKRSLELSLAHSPHLRTHAAFQALERLRLGTRTAAEPAPGQIESGSRLGEDHYPFDRTLARAAMPTSSWRMLAAADLPSLAARRRSNYAAYAQALHPDARLRPLHPDLPERTVPWVFPVLLRHRDAIDRRWRAAGVPLHTFGIWQHSSLSRTADRATREDAALLAQELLCLSIHQGLGELHIARCARLIRESLERDRQG